MNRWVVIALGVMAAVVIGRHMQRLGWLGASEAPSTAVAEPLGVRVANAEPLPPVDSGEREGGAVATPEPLPDTLAPASEVTSPAEGLATDEPASGEEPASSRGTDAATRDEADAHLRVPLNPEPPLPEKERPRTPPGTLGPLTQIDPHQMLFEPGEKSSKSVRRRSAAAPVRRDRSESKGPLTDVDRRQMLFEPGERPPRGVVRKTPVEPPVPKVQDPDPAPATDTSEPALDPSADAQTKARIMKRLLRVMELAGEKR